MTGSQRPIRLTRKERIGRTAVGMPARHPELITRKPRRDEWKQVATWLAEMWPNDEYAAIVAQHCRRDKPC